MSLKGISSIFLSIILFVGGVLVIVNGARQVEMTDLGEQGNRTRDQVVPFVRGTSLTFSNAYALTFGAIIILGVIVWMNGKKG